jgi:DNA replication protein DnaC
MEGFDMTPESWQWLAAQRAEAKAEAVRACGLPKSYLDGRLGFHTWQQRNAIEAGALTAAKEWVSGIGEKPSLLITGSIGTRKTGLALSAIAAAIDAGRNRSRFTTKLDMIGSVQRTFSVDDESAYDELMRYSGVPFLAIDDIDKGSSSRFVIQTLWTVIDTRVRNERPTIYTANAIGATSPLDAIYHRLATPGLEVDAESIVDRLRGSCVVVELNGASDR